jgi:hypothetical protein
MHEEERNFYIIEHGRPFDAEILEGIFFGVIASHLK